MATVLPATMLAETLAASGRIEAGLDFTARGPDARREHRRALVGGRNHRLRGVLLRANSPLNEDAAQAAFLKALAVARRQGAKSLELRSATRFARMLSEHDTRAEAIDLLAPVYNWFTEGRSTVDLMSAKALLDELNG